MMTRLRRRAVLVLLGVALSAVAWAQAPSRTVILSTDQVETVEIWQKADDKTVTADVWVYDPPALTEPWHVKQSYGKLSDPDKSQRIRYWNCGENQNNAVFQTKDGTTDFRQFTFAGPGDKQRGK